MLMQAIIDRVRKTPLGDTEKPYLWDDPELIELGNETIDELCEETFLLVDSSSLDICRQYVGIKSAWLAQGTNPGTLKVVTAFDFWNTIIGGAPKKYTFAVTDNIAMTACTTQAVSTYCRYLISTDYLFNITVTKGVDSTTSAGAILPELPAWNTPIGMLLIVTDATHTFTSGTNSLDVAGITATFESSPATFKTDSRVIRINEAQLDQVRDPLSLLDIYEMSRFNPGWRNLDAGMPCILIKKKDRDTYQVWPPAKYPDRLVLTVARRPLTAIDPSNTSVEPEIPAMYHKRLFSGIAFRAFQKQESDAYNSSQIIDQERLWHEDIEKVKQTENRLNQRNETNVLPGGAT
jgi:hypothetical protein